MNYENMNDFQDVKLPTAADVAGWQAGDVARREAKRQKGRSKFATRPGQEVKFETSPYTVVSGASYEVRGAGNPDAYLTGPRPQDPAKIVEKKEEKGK